MPKRIEFIDIAKGIGIILVVLGHNQINVTIPRLIHFIYTFHMPLFFLLSGMFFRENSGFFNLLRRRFHTILQPYIVTILMIYLVAFFFSETQTATILRRLAKAAYASGNYLEWIQLWFLPALFALNILVYVFCQVLYSRLPALWMRVLVLVAMLWAGVATIRTFWMYKLDVGGHPFVLEGLPFSIDLFLVTGAFFLIGYEMYRSLPEKFYASWWTLAGSGMLLLGLNLWFRYSIDLFSRTYQSFMINSLEALSGSILVLCISKQIAGRGGRLSMIFQYLGQVSLLLLIFHGPIQYYSYYKVNEWVGNAYIAALFSFTLGMGVPLLIYECLIRPNLLVARWFGVEKLSLPLEPNTVQQELKPDA